MLLELFVTSWILGFSGAMMPGPLLTVTVSETTRRGAKAGPLLMAGHALLELALVAALILGLKSFLNNQYFIITVSIVGGLFLIWMGYGMLRDARQGNISLELQSGPEKVLVGPVLTGMLVSLSNPYWTIWWATVGLGYLTSAWEYGMAGLFFFFTGHILADFTWYGVVAVAIARGKKVMSDRLYRRIIAVCGAFLIGLALTFIWNGIVRIAG
ncbi:LysE family transporter [Phosphitispora fastidiosa]|uniref:LysE family transporter n=1 Tax=Phosphitispora fastidiosa TaxID=2837202 RepID=UPI001E4EFC73|nr:LysE family transporter [Phosphitispora fastidiosa]MBU7005680.1 threonine/homoserine/homoserine lactone efflux protein [Phosphitispora fastidiosa]